MELPEGSIGAINFVAESCINLPQNEVHMLPCSINYNGPAPVSSYFRPKTADSILEGIEVKEAAFRGRRLLGYTTELPQDYCGLLLEKEVSTGAARSRKQKDNADVDIWNAKLTFKDITYWRHDDNPHSVTSGNKFFEWLHLASVIHRPVTSEDMSKEQNKSNKCGQKRKLEEACDDDAA